MPEAESSSRRGSGSSRSGAGPDPGRNEVVVTAGQRQYLMAPKAGLAARAAGVQPMSVGVLNAAVQGLDVVRRIKRPRETLATLGVMAGEASDIIVTNIEPERAQLVAATAPMLTIGENVPLGYGSGPVAPMREMPAVVGSLLAHTAVKPKRMRFRVLGAGDKPLEGAVVTLAGDTVPGQGITDASGDVVLDLYTLQDRPARSLFVMKPGGYWDVYLTEPKLSDSDVNVVRLRSYGETISGFPDSMQYGWGQRMMGLDRMAGFTGDGVKVAIIDSGADNTHPLLSHITRGRDFSEGADPAGWSNDLVGHGSHCAGVIAARSDGRLRGFAPDAEVHVLKVFPGGRYDSLIDALHYCIQNQIDVVNMSLGGDDEINPVVEQTLIDAVNAGVVCIVAAGNSGDAVKYPARSPNALAVAAVGDFEEAQPDSWDRSNIRPQFVAADGVFSPAFTCHGPEVAVCAPGVAIISTVPGGAYEAQTGTSMAAPHVTGLAALLLAHHPVFRDVLAGRNQARVAGLFSLIRSMCTPYPFGLDRTGAGLPKFDGLERVLRPSRSGDGTEVPGNGAGQQQGAGGPQLSPQGALGQALGGALGGWGGGQFGQGGLGQQIGATIGSLLPFQAGPQQWTAAPAPPPVVDPVTSLLIRRMLGL